MKYRKTAAGMFFLLLVILIFTGGCGAKKESSAQPRHQYTSLSELEDKRIGVTTGSVQAIQARERFPDADLFYYDTTTLDHYQEKTDAGITFEYQEKTGEMHMKTVFEGTDFDPLRQGDPVCTSLIRNAARDITYTCAEGKGIVEGILSRPLPAVYS